MSGAGHAVQSHPVSLGDGDRGSQNAARSLVDGSKYIQNGWICLDLCILKAAIRGEIEVLPVINLDPQEETVMEESHPVQGLLSHPPQRLNDCSEASGSQDS